MDERRRTRRDLPLLLGGAAVSAVGGSLTLLAVMVHLEPRGPGWVAAAMAAELVPVVALAPLAGRLVDRYPNRRLLVAALALQGLSVLVAATVGPTDGGAPVLLAALVCLGVGTTVANPAIAALLPHVAGEAAATRAYGWFSAISQAGFLVGFAVAGVLVEAAGSRAALLVNAGTYAVFAVAAAALRTQRVPDARAGRAARAAAWEGFRRLGADRLLLVTVTGLAAAILVTIVVNVAGVFYVLDDVGAGPGAYGVVTALWPAAGILGGWLGGRLLGDRALSRALALSIGLMGVGLVVAGSVPSIVVVGVGWVLGGTANALQRVCVNALVRSRVEDASRGRTFAAAGGVFQAANLAGLAVGAGVVAALGARTSLLAAGATAVVVSVVVLAVVTALPVARRALPATSNVQGTRGLAARPPSGRRITSSPRPTEVGSPPWIL